MIEILFYGLIILVVVCLLDTVDPNGRLFQVKNEDADYPPCATCGHNFEIHNAISGLGECYAELRTKTGVISEFKGICTCPEYKVPDS